MILTITLVFLSAFAGMIILATVLHFQSCDAAAETAALRYFSRGRFKEPSDKAAPALPATVSPVVKAAGNPFHGDTGARSSRPTATTHDNGPSASPAQLLTARRSRFVPVNLFSLNPHLLFQ